jgi:hypothetical protein
MATNKNAKKIAVQPQGKVRRSQMLTTYGPGALVDLLDYAVIVNGLDGWRYGYAGVETVDEPRLRERVAQRLKAHGQTLASTDAFRLPPAGDDGAPSPAHGVSARLFPRWFVCQNPKCRALTRYQSLDFKQGRFHHDCGHLCVPVRFVQACESGHIDDLNWIGFVHRGQPCDAVSLELDEGKTGDFSEVQVRCETCGRSRALINLKAKDMRPDCRGKRPWLGPDADEECDRQATLIVRTASSAYFSQTDSALTIPDPENTLYDVVGEHMGTLVAATPVTLPAFRTIPKVGQALAAHTDASVLAMVALHIAGEKPQRPPIRIAEFDRFIAAPPEQPGVVAPPDTDFFARTAQQPAIAGVHQVVLAHKLREVRVQVGFTRLDYPTLSITGDPETSVRSAPLGLSTDWLPAVEVFGEGVFIALNEEAVGLWETRPAVVARAALLEAAHEARYASDTTPPPFPGVRFYLLHSLAHLLLTAISLECGYSASAIRERIYCAPALSDHPMAAFLLSTATPGTEGTLGGLIDQGRKIEQHLAYALRLGRLCSNDPVCAAHAPTSPDDGVDGAACHGCLYVAESSCEFFNRYLDRALVVPCMGLPAELAFFGDAVWAPS